MKRSRLSLRWQLQLSVIGAVGLALVILITAFNVLLRQRLSDDADNVLAARASAEAATLQIRDGRVVAPEGPDAGALDARTWVFSGRTVVEGPRSDPVTEHVARELSTRSRGTATVAATQRRLHVVPVLDHRRRRVGAVVAELSLRAYNKTAHAALIASLALGSLILVLVAIAARYVISAALRPVAHMTAQAAAWSEADTGRRFALGPPHDELTQLAATLDSLLDRVATSLRHEQRFSSELSHELRSPLASVIAEAQLALRHPRTAAEHRGYERVLASAQQMRRTLETLLSAARVQLQGVHGSGDATAAVRAAVDGCKPLAAERGITVASVLAEHAFRIGVETEVAERVLAPLLENACRFGRSAVTVSALRRDGAVELRVADDGAGVPAADRQRVFEPGFSSGLDGAGLGLPLARRLARAAGGDVELADGDPGACFVVRLPAA
jgi:signal transduction histidine kinase